MVKSRDTGGATAIGPRILKAMREAGMTQAELAAAVGVDQSSVSGWGAGKYPRANKLPLIAKVLGVDVQSFFSDPDEVIRVEEDCCTNTPVTLRSLHFEVVQVSNSPWYRVRFFKNFGRATKDVERRFVLKNLSAITVVLREALKDMSAEVKL
ncbi:MAG: helix-turn-helix domain-containing protein [Chitinispirillia bacterium]|nr:helix-turn-helix domain-containing protein [Chitinispirillia bacterium]MCL2268579.1 helix-turn-helix domain-containing protein [Chitinispirillia bacterium]